MFIIPKMSAKKTISLYDLNWFPLLSLWNSSFRSLIIYFRYVVLCHIHIIIVFCLIFTCLPQSQIELGFRSIKTKVLKKSLEVTHKGIYLFKFAWIVKTKDDTINEEQGFINHSYLLLNISFWFFNYNLTKCKAMAMIE